MKYQKWLAVALCIFLLASCSGCGAGNFLDQKKGEEALLSIDGAPVLTVAQMRQAVLANQVYAETYGVSQTGEKELFLRLAEKEIMAYAARMQGLNETDRSIAEEEFDAYLAQIQDQDLYAKELNYAANLQIALGMGDEAFRKWNVDQMLLETDAEALSLEILSQFTKETDATVLSNLLAENLQGLNDMLQIDCTYPGLEGHYFTFESVI